MKKCHNTSQCMLFLALFNSTFPAAGIIPANEETEVAVTFAPVEFQTAYMRIQLVISQYNSQPIICTFTGTSTPGLLK